MPGCLEPGHRPFESLPFDPHPNSIYRRGQRSCLVSRLFATPIPST